ncbi:hypothetical protein HPB47_005610 [Ixodes persulcatus]|uniref:Uncharacterized protein n=1 Tax=Ixodes persulcatus TaxID=34615 RepID=A0AC60PDG1_IXOPE|nr:hypothetical protein HPB47_005610 [Ixodes persulcatus]
MTLSKFLSMSLPYNCYEIGHTWTPHCSEAWLDLWFITFVRSLRLYGLLYLRIRRGGMVGLAEVPAS